MSEVPNSLSLLVQQIRQQTQLPNQAQLGAFGALGASIGAPLAPFLGQRPADLFGLAGQQQPQQTQANQNMQTVFIGDLPKDISMVELYEYIKSVAGECELVLKRPQMRFFYYAFARFQDILDARKLLEEVRYPELHGKTCRALPYDKELLQNVQVGGNVFVKGFGAAWTHKDLHAAFKGFGEIVSARVSIEEGHKSRGFGYVQFKKTEAAKKAVEEMDGKVVDESFTLQVSIFQTPHERGVSSSAGLGWFSKKFNNLFVKNFPREDFTSEDLQKMFEPFGEIVSCKVSGVASEEEKAGSSQKDYEARQAKGYGFVCFNKHEDARKAFDHFQNKDDEPEEVKEGEQAVVEPRLYVVPALKREVREAFIRLKTLKYKKQMARHNLYFRGFPLDPTVSVEETEKELFKFFQTFGDVMNVKLMKNRRIDEEAQQKSSEHLLGFGFVCFKTADEAARARAEASKSSFRGCHLYISQFETKEQRKAHMLERIDHLEFLRYKKREDTKKDMQKLQNLSDELRTEQGQLLLTLLKLLASISQQRQKTQQQQHQARNAAAPAPRQDNQPPQRARYQRNRSQDVSPTPTMPMPQQTQQVQPGHQQVQPGPQVQQQIISPNQIYYQRFTQVITSQQFVSIDETTKRRFLGHFIYDYVVYILKQTPTQHGFIDRSDLSPKVTGMLIEIANFQQLLMTCQSLENLALKVREAYQLIQQASAEISTQSQTKM